MLIGEELLCAGPVLISSLRVQLLPHYTSFNIESVGRRGYFGQPPCVAFGELQFARYP